MEEDEKKEEEEGEVEVRRKLEESGREEKTKIKKRENKRGR